MEYLSDGISESLINNLSQVPGLRVIARSSSFKYKGKEVDLQEVANALGVESVITGRVAQRDQNLLINIELVNARDKTQTWGEQYTRPASDLPAVLSEISGDVVEKLRLRLTPTEQQNSDVVIRPMPKPSITTRRGCITSITSEPILALGQSQTWRLTSSRKRSGWIRIMPSHTFNLDTPIPG